ncbi:universal stress protein [Streptomyces sp. NPDC005355]|uniref:universal stress protein n=1 Tax=Streptomyces sp. NPDC005355 TaxID=3157038 RepID=UPI0033A634DA
MSRTVTVGLDGSPQSLAAARWAGREAWSRRLPLRLVCALDWHSFTYAPLTGTDTVTRWARRMPHEAEARLRRDHPDLRIINEQVTREPVTSLLAAAEDAELLVLGSRGLSRVTGFLVGSVALSVMARAELPLVLVRADEAAEKERRRDSAAIASRTAACRDVVLGLDLRRPADPVIEFAFDAAARRKAALRVLHGWSRPSPYGYTAPFDAEPAVQNASELRDVLRPWREKFPDVEVRERSVIGSAAGHLVDASADAALVVVGRFTHGPWPGPRIGPVTHAVLHHSAAPVAVIAHD